MKEKYSREVSEKAGEAFVRWVDEIVEIADENGVDRNKLLYDAAIVLMRTVGKSDFTIWGKENEEDTKSEAEATGQ